MAESTKSMLVQVNLFNENERRREIKEALSKSMEFRLNHQFQEAKAVLEAIIQNTVVYPEARFTSELAEVREKYTEIHAEIRIREAIKKQDFNSLKNIFNEKQQLNFSSVDGDDAALICSALTGNDSVSKLRFIAPIGDLAAQPIKKLLVENKAIQELELTNCVLTQTGIRILAEGIRNNGTLTSLTICGTNYFGNMGMVHLSSALVDHHSINTIIIGSELIPKTSWVIFAGALKSIRDLEHVEFYDSDFSDRKVLAELMEAFHNHVNIKSLYLRQNKITLESVPAITEMLSFNKSIETLEIWCFDDTFDDKAVNSILSGLDKNNSLKKLDIVCSKRTMEQIMSTQVKISEHFCDVEISCHGGTPLLFKGSARRTKFQHR